MTCFEHLRAVLKVARSIEEDFCFDYGAKSLREFSGGGEQSDILDAAEEYLKSHTIVPLDPFVETPSPGSDGGEKV